MAEICTPCLIGVNTTMEHRIKDRSVISYDDWQELVGHQIDPWIAATAGPRAIIHWYTSIMEKSGGDARFTYGAMDDTLTEIAILGGTPMCVGHLWQNLGGRKL